MIDDIDLPDISAALEGRAFPTVTLWNRLEGRPRTTDFSRAMKAEVRDALWMLSRQWQMGEFRGDDAGTPIFAGVHAAVRPLSGYQAKGPRQETFSDHQPAEARVEQRRIPFQIGSQPVSLDIRLEMGRQWIRMLRRSSAIAGLGREYINRFGLRLPDPESVLDAAVCAHPEVWCQLAAVAGRAMDGYAFYSYLNEDPVHRAYDGISGLDDRDRELLQEQADKFITWYEGLYLQPDAPGGDAWEAAHLEYRFSCSTVDANGEVGFSAGEYHGGHLDWYDLDHASDLPPGRSTPPPAEGVELFPRTLIPVPAIFEGMPNTRWWSFEDSRTNLGQILPDTTDLAKLLLVEFGLVYANDWFLFPLTLPIRTATEIRGLAVTDVFGERRWILPYGQGSDQEWQRWSMFNHDGTARQTGGRGPGLLLLPLAAQILNGEPLEEVVFIRDEIGNLVWAIEKTIPLASGRGKSGSEAALEMRRYFEKASGEETGLPVLQENSAAIRYELMTDVPENWIPFIPVHVAGQVRETQLQRAAMPRLLRGGPRPPDKVEPRTVLVREGLDGDESLAYLVYEEEIPRAGVHISQGYRRTRWYDGRVVTWLGARKQVGRGEGSSGLAFDQLEPKDSSGSR